MYKRQEGGTGIDSNCDGIDGELALSIFVAKNGDDAATGTIESPLRSIQMAIDLASAQGVAFVLVATGAYVETLTLRDGVRAYGGYSADFTVRDPVAYETAIIANAPELTHPGAVNAIDVGFTLGQPTGLEGFVLFGAAGSTPGASSYGLYVKDSGPELRIAYNTIVAADGADGASGGAGTSGQGGAAGAAGTAALWLGSSSCSPDAHAAGGEGGSLSCDGASVAGGDLSLIHI